MWYLFALIKYSDANVPSLLMTVCKIPFSMRTVPSACNVTQTEVETYNTYRLQKALQAMYT